MFHSRNQSFKIDDGVVRNLVKEINSINDEISPPPIKRGTPNFVGDKDIPIVHQVLDNPVNIVPKI